MTNKEAITHLEWLSEIDFTKEFIRLPAVTNEEQVEALQMAIEALKAQDDTDTNVSSRKGVFIPGITVEMFRNASLEGVEELMASGEMEDISLPSAQPELIEKQHISEDLNRAERRE